MTIESSSEDNSWNRIDPDPGILTDLCSKIGAVNVQVEQVKLPMGKEYLLNLMPVYGLMILVEHNIEAIPHPHHEPSNLVGNDGLYFANQIVHNAYALHALLNILLNCDYSVNIGEELTHFKQFTREFSPALRGLTLTNSQVFRCAYNKLCSTASNSINQSKVIHPISYIRHNGYLWELDQLSKNPIKLGSCSEDNWLDKAHVEVAKKCGIFHAQQLLVSVWTIIEDRKIVYQRKLIDKELIKDKIEHELDITQPDWRASMNIDHWEEEYNHVMSSERYRQGKFLSTQLLETYSHSFDPLRSDNQTRIKATLEECKKQGDILSAWLQTQDESLRLYECLGLEVEKQQLYEKTCQQRKHDYMPFIRAYIRALYEEGHLQHLLTNKTTNL